MTVHRDREIDANHWMECGADACKQGRVACPCPQACEQPSERSWFWSDASVFGIFCLTIVGFVAGWFGG